MILALLAAVFIGFADAANYMYEKSSVSGLGYKNMELIVCTQYGHAGDKLVEKESGSGNVIAERAELEAERQLRNDYYPAGSNVTSDEQSRIVNDIWECRYPSGINHMDYINFTKEAEFEYMPVSYQTGVYDQKWLDKLCVQNYRIGAVLTEMYTHAEHLQRTTEIRTRSYGFTAWGDAQFFGIPVDIPCCTGVLESNINSNVIGVAHIGWLSRDPAAESQLKARHAEYGRSIEDLTGVFSIQKFVQLWGNSTCGAVSVDWLPCM